LPEADGEGYGWVYFSETKNIFIRKEEVPKFLRKVDEFNEKYLIHEKGKSRRRYCSFLRLIRENLDVR